MMGTLATVLAGHRIRTLQDRYRAEVTGDIEAADGVLKITRIRVAYHLRAPREQHAAAREALERYLPLCPAAQSVVGCIAIEHTLHLEEAAD
jgi:organic hydroperoxide reductase OsmC/OhrA